MTESEHIPSSYGWLARGTDEPIRIERNDQNDHFFLHTEHRGDELVYQGSALIASLLEMHQVIKKVGPEDDAPNVRALAFFDKRGDFYGPVVLNGLYRNVNANGRSTVKHTAIFEPANTEDEAFAIPIDDIYCLSLAKPEESEQILN